MSSVQSTDRVFSSVLTGSLSGFVAQIRAYNRQRLTVTRLEALSDERLADAGLSRDDVRAMADRISF